MSECLEKRGERPGFLSERKIYIIFLVLKKKPGLFLSPVLTLEFASLTFSSFLQNIDRNKELFRYH